ncbi:hypothetical protein IV55_GL001261 [Furfurilactobacillus siliginis]|nr:hypothetical protein IV55_GL001261 [Furfurilactobacillus siliginis]
MFNYTVLIVLATLAVRYSYVNRRTMFDHWKQIHPIETLKHDLRELSGKGN